jgi:hypothetical protein
MRQALLALVAFGTLGMSAELVLIGHYEDTLQIAPLAAGGAALALIVWVATRPSMFALRVFQFLMLSLIGTGITGMTVHFVANAEFQREIDPALSGAALFWKSIEATAPPALAPGVMVQLGLLGLLYTYKHPVLAEDTIGR